MEKELVIAEKPSAARKIAVALKNAYDSASLQTFKMGKVSYYTISTNEKEIYVVSAVGHMFGLKQKNSGFTYPVFEVEWRPLYEVEKKAYYVKDYLKVIRSLGKDVDNIIVATDFDIEGETIAYNILRFILNTTSAKRMKFSTMTIGELKQAYLSPLKNILENVAKAGETRHIIDFYFGINLSRSLMFAMKAAGKFKVMSIGRVQGPALAILAEREEEIKRFTPIPYWKIKLLTEGGIEAWHIKGRIFDKEKALIIFDKIKNEKEGLVSDVKLQDKKIVPPHPFSLTDLQTEAYAIFKINPKETQDIAQFLYENAWISYPRTSSQKYPSHLPLKSVLEKFAKSSDYGGLALSLLNETQGVLKPHNGKKDDEAHPAIYPTGEIPQGLNKKQKAIYDLIVKRFFATFSSYAVKRIMHVSLDVKGEVFVFEGSKIIGEGWMKYYAPYVKLEDTLPSDIKKGRVIPLKKIDLVKKETKPPSRYSPAGIIKELEKRKLGTKATRAVIIENLYKRGYIRGQRSIEVTELGMKVYKMMKEHIPEIISERMTRKLEEELEGIEKGKVLPEKVLNDAKDQIIKVLEKIKPNEKEIGEELLKAEKNDVKKHNFVGKCPSCGSDLMVKISKNKKRFVGCVNYPSCSYTLPLPQIGNLVFTQEKCSICGTYMVEIRNRRSQIKGCLNPACENSWYKKIKNNKG